MLLFTADSVSVGWHVCQGYGHFQSITICNGFIVESNPLNYNLNIT